MNILLATNSKVFSLVLTLVYSIFQNNREEKITIWLCYSDLKQNEINVIDTLIQKLGGGLKKLYIAEELYQNLNTEYYPKEVYYRILAIDLLPNDLDKILYMDVDMIVKGSLKELYDTDLSGYAFAACEDIYSRLMVAIDSENNVTTNDVLKKQTLGISQEYFYINAGMLLLNLDYFRKNHGVRKLIDYIQNELDEYKFPDQDALNAVFYSKIKILSWEKYNCPPMFYMYKENGEKNELMNYWEISNMEETIFDKKDILSILEEGIILHFAGTRKPWIENPGDSQVVDLFGIYYERALENVILLLEDNNSTKC